MILRKLAVAVLALWLLALAALIIGSLTGCTHVIITDPGQIAPATEAKQLGGMVTVTNGATSIQVDNRESWTDTTKMVTGITTTISTLKGAIAAIDLRKAKNAAEAANEGAKIAAGTEAQRIAADQAIQSQALANEAAAAELAAQAAP